MRRLEWIGSAFAICAALAAPLSAQQAPPAGTQQSAPAITQFDDAIISRLLLDGQTTWRIEGGPDGRPVYRVSAQGGLRFTVQPQACSEQTGCVGLVMVATFVDTRGRNLSELDGVLNSFNDRNSSAKAYRTPDGVVLHQSYINAAFGISYANARAQMLVFGRNVVALRQALSALASSP